MVGQVGYPIPSINHPTLFQLKQTLPFHAWSSKVNNAKQLGRDYFSILWLFKGESGGVCLPVETSCSKHLKGDCLSASPP